MPEDPVIWTFLFSATCSAPLRRYLRSCQLSNAKLFDSPSRCLSHNDCQHRFVPATALNNNPLVQTTRPAPLTAGLESLSRLGHSTVSLLSSQEIRTMASVEEIMRGEVLSSHDTCSLSNSSTTSYPCSENSPFPGFAASTTVALIEPDGSASSAQPPCAKRWFRRSYGSNKMLRSASAHNPQAGSVVLEQHASEAAACENNEGPHTISDDALVTSDDSGDKEGQNASAVGPRKSSLSVRTQHESLSLRTSFRSQLQLGIVLKSVRFDKLSIREYPIVIGDSPSTSRGVPLSIGWKYAPECTVDLDAYEATRVVGGVCERRAKSELR